MRLAFVETLVELAAQDARVILLTGDLGYSVLERFADRYPDRFFNAGVAEQNMVGMATGLAEAGFVPFVYSIATFASMRPYEFIRNGPVLHRLPVRIVGVGGGFEYGHAGVTHYALEDAGLMRLQPGLTVVSPADHQQTRTALRATWDLPGPVYYRLGKDDHTTVPGLEGAFQLERVHRVREGTDLLFLVMGAVTAEAVAAAELLAAEGISCAVGVVAALGPTVAHDLKEQLRGFSRVMTIEAHYITGGLGSLVSEVIAENALACRLMRCGVTAMPRGISGSQAYMENAHGLNRGALFQRALHHFKEDPS